MIHGVILIETKLVAAFETEKEAIEFVESQNKKAEPGKFFKYREVDGEWVMGFPGEGWE